MKKLVFGLFLFMLFAFPSIECVNAQDSNYEQTQLKKEIVRLHNEDKEEEALAKTNLYIAKYSNVWGYNMKGIILKSMGRYDEALSTFEYVLPYATGYGGRATIYFNIAGTYFDQDKFSKAVPYYQEAINVSEKNKALFYKARMGLCYLYMGDVKKTQDIYFEVYPLVEDVEKTLKPNDKGKAYVNTSHLAFHLKRGSEDLYLTKKFLGTRKTNRAQLFYATKLAHYGYTNEAKEQFGLVDKSKVDPESLAKWYWRNGDEDKASHYLKKSLYQEKKTSVARENWKRKMRRNEKLPADFWKDARDKEWFRKLVY